MAVNASSHLCVELHSGSELNFRTQASTNDRPITKGECVIISRICENPRTERKACWDLPLTFSISFKPALPSASLQLIHIMLAYLHILVVGEALYNFNLYVKLHGKYICI